MAQLVKVCLQCGRPGFNPWVGNIPWRRERLPIPVSGLENSMHCKGHGVTKSQTWLSDFHFHSYLHFKHTVQRHAWVHLHSSATVTHSSPELFLSCQIETLYPSNSHSPFPPPLAPGNHPSTFCLYESDYAKYLV